MIVLDTCLLYSMFVENDPSHNISKTIFTRILNREYAQPILLDCVFNELLTLTYVRTKNFDLCIQIVEFLDEYVNKDALVFIHTPSEVFWKANQTFLKQDINSQKRFLSFTDAIIGEMAEWLNASYIGTFDMQFYRFSQNIISE